MTNSNPSKAECDVLIVGMGPVGKMAALMLARKGHSVAVVERKLKSYPLPRAVAHDAEIARILQNVGMPPSDLAGVSEAYDDMYMWVNKEDEPIHVVDFSGTDPSGWNNTYFYHQPSLEARLDAALETQGTVQIMRGALATMESHDATGVEVEITDLDLNHLHHLRARFVLGADGAQSTVRTRLEIPWHDLGYFFDWLVVDVLPKGDAPMPHLAKQVCDYERPTTVVPGGPGRRRWEFMRLEGESSEELAKPERIWQLLAPYGLNEENAQIERGVVYTFKSGWAESFQSGRVFLTGDAAHLMPPFAGQGLASGMRDVANLTWKLDLVLAGKADEQLLESYTGERVNHVFDFINFSMALGRIICVTDAEEARKRDEAMKAAMVEGAPQAPPAPRLGEGLHRGETGGYLSRQGKIVTAKNADPMLYDDVFGAGSLILGSADLAASLTEDEVHALSELGLSTTVFDASSGPAVPGIEQFHDAAGVYRPWFNELASEAVLVRPDFYVYGTASTAEELHQLVADFTASIHVPLVAATQTTHRMERS